MLKIKLARFGKRKQPHYRIVINEARDKRDGAYLAVVGHYGPTQVPKILSVDLEAYKSWLTKGAQPTETVASLVTRFESGNPFPERKASPSKKVRAKAKAAQEAAEAEKAAPAEETPVVEAKAEAVAEVTETAAPEVAAETVEAEATPAA
jgi:small subunit ribosomal protein S16